MFPEITDCADEIREWAKGVTPDGWAKLKPPSRIAIRRLQSLSDPIITDVPHAKWYKSISLPAHQGQCRIALLAEKIWYLTADTPTAAAVSAAVHAFAQEQPLTYPEIWMFPQALREHAIRAFAETEGNCPDKTIAFIRIAGRISLEKDMHRLSMAESCLLKDPGKVYPRLTRTSQRSVREKIVRIAKISNAPEIQIVQTALALCSEKSFNDITQVFLTDRGISALQNRLQIPIVKRYHIHPDPKGIRLIAFTCSTFTLFAVLFSLLGSWLLLLPALPLLWCLARILCNNIFLKFSKDKPLPCIRADALSPEARTLLVIPAMIACEKDLNERLRELETLSAMPVKFEAECLLLSDLPEAHSRHMSEDDSLMDISHREIARMNQFPGRHRCHVLWRERRYNPIDDIYQPYERKRGALMDLFALLSGENSVFLSRGSAEALRSKGFRYAITLDAGTIAFPGSFDQLVGMMEWPANPYAVIQPAMHSAMRRPTLPWDRIISPNRGYSAYPAMAAELYQNQTGQGIYGGKGIIDIAAFRYALEGRLPDNAILSHDLIEGAIANAAYAADVIWLEFEPATSAGYFARLERWTRGDWQLLPFLLNGEGMLNPLTRFQLADNLLRSLCAPSIMALLIASGWQNIVFPAVLALASFALLHFPNPAGAKVLLSRLCLLPLEAWTTASAAIRALYRTYVSHKRMLQWKPSDTADQTRHFSYWPNCTAAILLLLSSRSPMLLPGYFALAALFLIGVPWTNMLAQRTHPATLDTEQREFLTEIANRTWNFFHTFTQNPDCPIPPDCVQQAEKPLIARKTSPTNIAMYLLSCLCACRLGIINKYESEERIRKTLITLESLPRNNGQLYNWYDIDSLEPLPPLFLSSVDNGNLACALLTLSSAEIGNDLRLRARNLAFSMDFSFLYDEERALFRTGISAEDEKASDSHYDLFSSESRLLSLAAISMGMIPAEHWLSLGRPLRTNQPLPFYLSWSGTMFEYLMPDLLFAAPEDSAWAENSRSIVEMQIRQAKKGIWGISESCCADKNADGFYQYKAFGLLQTGIHPKRTSLVFSPYSAALALHWRPVEAAESLQKMVRAGYASEYGLYEAIDMRTAETQPVAAHMTHHQGMILCSITNALCDGYLQQLSRNVPELRAIEALLHEQPIKKV